ncbi:MAG: hypothetical protein ABIO83_11495 [Ilumatobacteraceae bacterium]
MNVRRVALIVALLLSGALIACGSTDKSGAPVAAAPAELNIATRTLGTGGAADFADTVTKASGGRLTIVVESSAHRSDGRPAEASILADVASGNVALGVVSVEALQAAGVHSLDPLIAPGVVTTVEFETAIAGSALATTMLGGVATAGVVGLAIVPGPIHLLVGMNDAIDSPEGLTGKRASVFATADQAAALFTALGTTTTLDPRLEPPANADVFDASPGVIARRNLAPAVHVVANVPLWPDPTVIVMNADAFEALNASDRQLLLDAGLASAAVTGDAISVDESTSLDSLCADGRVEFDTMSADGLAVMATRFADVTDALRATGAGGVLAEIEKMAPATVPSTAPRCVSDAAPTGSEAKPLTGAETALVGTWTADVTAQALEAAHVRGNENGEVGPMSLQFDIEGHLDIVMGDGSVITTVVTVADGVLTLTPYDVTLEQGSGEQWRYRWSVFNDRLTWTEVPGEGIDPGPTSFISQPFTKE